MIATHNKNILINVPRFALPGGVANYYTELRKYLGQDKRYFEIGANPGESGGLGFIKRLLGDWWRFHRKLSSGNYSLVHLNPSLGSKSILRDGVFLLIAHAHSVPVLAFFHGWDMNIKDAIKGRFSTAFGFVFGRAAGIVVLAEEFGRQLRQIGVDVPIFQMTTCVDDAVFTRIRPQVSKEQLNILYLSRLDHGKGVVEAVRSFALLKREWPGAVLKIAGDGPERAAADQAAKELQLDDVIFLGHVEGKAKQRLFLDADIFFFPTFFGEGMPTTVLEAMGYGLPVITRAVGGLRDFFENGRMGFVTESSDVADFASLLQRLARDMELCRQIGHYNRVYAEEHFAASKVAGRLENIYDQVVASDKSSRSQFVYSNR